MKYKILKGQLGLKVLSEKSDNTQVNNIRRPVQKIKYNYVPMSYSNRMKLQAQKYKDDNSLFSGSRLLDRTKELGKVIRTPLATLAASATAVASPTIAARLLTGATSAVGFGQLGMGSGNSLHDAAYGMLGEAVAPLVGKVLDKGFTAAKQVGTNILKKKVFIKEPNSFTRGIGTSEEGLKDLVESGIIRGNPRGTSITAHQFVKSVKMGDLKPVYEKDRDIALNYFQNNLDEKGFNTMKKYFPNTTYEKPTGLSLLRKAKPLEGVSTYAEYSKKYKTPNIDKLPSENIYKDIKQPYAYFYDDGRNPIISGHNYATSKYGVRVKNASSYKPFIPESHLHYTTEHPVNLLDPNVEVFKKGPLGITLKMNKSKLINKYTTHNQNVFKSEIDWGKWNKEIPQNKKLLNEYNEIEKSAKESGNWMKNTDGSNFKGTPEQFVQQQSSNFKKAFPNPILDDSNNIQINYHGSRNKLIGNKFNQKYSNQHGQVYGSGIYTSPSKEFANDYATRTPKGKMYELYINSNNPQKPIPPEYNVNININDAVLKPGYDFLKSGSEQIIPFSNYPKSAIGNNGMFDMTNPNIYKTITGISAGLGALKLNKQ